MFVAAAVIPAYAEDNIILFGGLSYVDAETTPAMAAMLARDAAGSVLEDGDALIEFAGQAIDDLNAHGGLSNVSRFEIVQYEDEAWDIATSLGAEREVGQLISSFHLYGDDMYGLMLLANYEDVIPQTLSYNDADSGARITVKKRTYIVGMSALLVELSPDAKTTRIVLSSSDLGRASVTTDVDFVPSDAQKATLYKEAYTRAIGGVLAKLEAAKAPEEGARSSHMVTGFTMRPGHSADLLNYDVTKNPTAQDLSKNLCTIPDGCTSRLCRKRGAMLMHSLTSSLSEAGFSVLPPITAEYGADVASGIELNLSLFADDARLLGDVQSITIDPAQAATKWIAVWRGSEFIDYPGERFPELFTDRIFFSRIGYIRGQTGFDGCTDVTSLERDPVPEVVSSGRGRVDGGVMGCSVENFLVSQGSPGRGVARDHYTLAALDHVDRLGSQLKGERVSNDVFCKPYAGAD
jgi:hypothetical protein